VTLTTWSTTVRAIPCLRAAGGDWSKDLDWNIDIDFMVDYLHEDYPPFATGRSYFSGTSSTTWSTTVRATPCLRAAGGDWSKDFDFDYIIDYRPRNTLPEGRGW
jgi:hypothetical protein